MATVLIARFGITPTDKPINDKPGLACRMEVIEGMRITSMSPFIKLEGITKVGQTFRGHVG